MDVLKTFDALELTLFGQAVDSTRVLDAYSVTALTFIVLLITEFVSWDAAWKKKIAKKENWELYKSAIVSNAEHYFIVGPLAYFLVSCYVASTGDYYPRWVSIPGVFLTQAVGYASAHAWMHRTENYWIHKYHHTFSERTFVRPIAANSVTLMEFSVAYALPIVLGTMIFRPDTFVLRVVASTISLTNLLIHTPAHIFPEADYLPSWAVTNIKHFHHHEKDVRRYYSAPIFDLDGVLGLVSRQKKE